MIRPLDPVTTEMIAEASAKLECAGYRVVEMRDGNGNPFPVATDGLCSMDMELLARCTDPVAMMAEESALHRGTLH